MTRLAPVPALALLAIACSDGPPPMTLGEAAEGFQQVLNSGEAEHLMIEPIEISTSFTIGSAVEAAAAELRTFVDSQLECTTTTIDGATITIDYGTLDDACVYNGHTYAGVHSITIQKTDAAELAVNHVFTELTNGEVALTGTADVTWSEADGLSRHVVHDFVWTDADGSYNGQGDRVQTLIDEELGLLGGIQVEGERTWTGADGREWLLDIEAVQIRGQDPVPQAGAYHLTNPDEKHLDLTFTRIDDDTIEVVLYGLREAVTWLVSAEGSVLSE